MARYKKQERINSGGFGVVYRAVRIEDSEIVAYKELPLGANEEEKSVLRVRCAFRQA
jgi:serine/threonine protein kinase